MKASPEEIERHRAAERLKGERDAADRLATARFLGHQEGFREGFDEGFKIGFAESIAKCREEAIAKSELVGSIRLLQQLLQQPETSSEELIQLPEQNLVQLDESLRRQFGSKKGTKGTPPVEKP